MNSAVWELPLIYFYPRDEACSVTFCRGHYDFMAILWPLQALDSAAHNCFISNLPGLVVGLLFRYILGVVRNLTE